MFSVEMGGLIPAQEWTGSLCGKQFYCASLFMSHFLLSPFTLLLLLLLSFSCLNPRVLPFSDSSSHTTRGRAYWAISMSSESKGLVKRNAGYLFLCFYLKADPMIIWGLTHNFECLKLAVISIYVNLYIFKSNILVSKVFFQTACFDF